MKSGITACIRNNSHRQGFSLTELLVALGLIGVIVAVALPALTSSFNATEKWGRVTEDYLLHLSSIYNQAAMKTGEPPINEADIADADDDDGIPRILSTSETVATYTAASPANLAYPKSIVVYVKPEQVAGMSNPILAGTYDREWLLLDMNGAAAPNSVASNGDRVLVHVDNQTGIVLTAYQKACNKTTFVSTYGKSFYDDYKGYDCASPNW